MLSTEQVVPSSKANYFSLNNTAFVILFGGLLLLPLFFISYEGFTADVSKTLFLTGCVYVSFLLWLLSRIRSGTISVPKSTILASWALVTLVFFVSALFSPAKDISFFGFTYETGTALSMIVFLVLMFLSSLFFGSQKVVTRFYQLLLLVFSIIFLFQAIRLVFGADVLSFGGAFANNTSNFLGKWNDLGIFAGMIIVLLLITLETLTLSRVLKSARYVMLALSLTMLAVVNFFIAWVVVGIFALILFIYNSVFLHPLKSHKGAIISLFLSPSFAVMVISLVFLIAGSTIGAFISDKLNILQVEVRPSWSATGIVLKETIKDRPLLGSGPNRFSSEWLLHKPEVINSSIFWNTEFNSGVGLLPTFVITTGVLGAVALLIFLTLLLYEGVRFLLFSPENKAPNYVVLSSFFLAAYVWVISFFYIPTVSIFAFAPFMTGIFIAGLISEGRIKNYTASYFSDPRAGFVSVLFISICIIGVVFAGYELSKKFSALAHFQNGRIAFNVDVDMLRAEAEIEKAIKQSNSDVYYRALSEIKIREVRDLLSKEAASSEAVRLEFQSFLGGGINAGQRAVQLDSTNYLNWLTLSRVYASVVPFVQGAYENAKTALVEARARNPKNPLLLLEEGRLEISNNNVTQGRGYIEQAVQMKPDYADAIFALAQLDIADGEIDKATAALDEASILAPNDQGLFFQIGLLKFNSKDYKGAALALERAVALNSQFANAKYFLGLSYDRLKRRAEAVAQFEDLAKSNPENSEVKRILGNLKAGRSALTDFTEPVFPEELKRLPIEE
ncbi:MAG: tetratricopeptide repeat protein [bacterium]|nr:tetratricopeptide repeat protein [bacterium]